MIERPPIKVSILMPVFNERATVEHAVARVRELPVDLQIVCVDD